MSDSSKHNNYLIFDTNIIQYSGSKLPHRSSEVLKFIFSYQTKGFICAISNISVYESFQRCTKIKEEEISKALNSYEHFEVSQKVLLMAAFIADLYRHEKIPDMQISDGDKIIAATAILTESLILTANPNDFPRPFFNEFDKKLILYLNEKKRDALIVLYILKPDTDVINKKFEALRNT